MNTEEETIYGAAAQPAANQKTSSKPEDNSWKRVTIAGTSAILLGAGTVAASTLFSNEEADADDNVTDDSELHVAEVDQNLSFADAFAEARHQVGTGGVFHWHGNVYSTFTAEEWDSLTPAERDAFAQLVQPEITDEAQHPTGVDHTTHHTATQHEHHDAQPAKQSTHHEQPEHTEQPEHAEQSEHVDHTEQSEHVENHDQPAGGTAQTVSEDVGGAHEPEVHFLGVESGEIEGQQVTMGHMTVDDVHVALIDVDNDRMFEISIADTNRNNQFDEQDTIEDISDQNLSVDQFAEASVQEASISPDEATLAMNQESQDLAPDMPDYVNDADLNMA